MPKQHILTIKNRWESAAARRVLKMAEVSSIEEAIPKLVATYLSGVVFPPTDLNALCSKFEVTVSESSSVIGAGALIKQKGRFIIHYAPDLTSQRRRFTIAHELGHIIVDTAGPRGPQHGKELERLCDMFATEILMPKKTFVEQASNEIGIKEIFRLARLFDTSLTSTAIRYAELLRVSVFEATDTNVVWGKGVIRKGAVRQLDDSLRLVIEKSLNGNAGSEELYVNTNGNYRHWIVEYRPYGKSNRVLVLMHSASQY
jgi:Zn-dependent peptidase ImmA (M78 family)